MKRDASTASRYMRSILLITVPPLILLTCFLAAAQTSQTQTYGPLTMPADFAGDWYSVDGGPYLEANLARSSVYRNENTSLFLTITNIGRVTSFQAVAEPMLSRPDEVFAAQKELQLEALRSSAQDVSVRLKPQNGSAMNLKREVAYAGSLRDGQVSQVLEFPIEVYENTVPGDYRFMPSPTTPTSRMLQLSLIAIIRRTRTSFTGTTPPARSFPSPCTWRRGARWISKR